MITKLVLPVLGIALLAWSISAFEPARGPEDSFTLADLEWMAGSWVAQDGKELTEELWMPPRGSLMLGLNRSTRSGGLLNFEYLRIEQGLRGCLYMASPRGKPPTPFRLTECEEGYALFENPDHDFPKRIEYRMEEEFLVIGIGGDKIDKSWKCKKLQEIVLE